ncbi:MAG: hypothetical protein ACTH8F_08720 [Microbacterium sp.]
MSDRTVDAVLARRRAHRDRIVLDPEAEERLRKARAALGLTKQTTTKEIR